VIIQFFKKIFVKEIINDNLIFCILNDKQYVPGDKIKFKNKDWEITRIKHFSRLKTLNNKYYFLYGVFGKEIL